MEVVGGWASNSLALMSDASHAFTDAGAISVSIAVATAIRRGGSEAKRRAVGGVVNGILLAASAIWVLIESAERLQSPPSVAAPLMVAIALLGAIGNYAQCKILQAAQAGHVTYKSTNFHVLSDLWQSVGVVVGGFAIWRTGFTLLDPLISIVVGFAMAFWAVRIIAESLALLRRST